MDDADGDASARARLFSLRSMSGCLPVP